MNLELNVRALRLAESLIAEAAVYRVSVQALANGTRVVDCGVNAMGGLRAGLLLARVCLADLAEVSMVPGVIVTTTCPHVQVSTDHPVAACMASQYAGWQISVDLASGKKYFAMGSGPMRAAAGVESLFEKIGCHESTEVAVGVLETRRLPPEQVSAWICKRAGIPPSGLVLLAAPTASLAGCVQIVARSVETALHKLHELGFDLTRVVTAQGTAPLPPVAHHDLAAIGRTNDAVLYGGSVTLWVKGDDSSIESIGPRVPSVSSPDHGVPFAEIFERAGRDFYKIDPHLFSPAEVMFCNLESGRSMRFGRCEPAVLLRSFGLPGGDA